MKDEGGSLLGVDFCARVLLVFVPDPLHPVLLCAGETVGDGGAGEVAGGEGELEVVAAGGAGEVEDFAGEEEVGDQF